VSKYRAKKIDRGFYEYRGYFLLRFRTQQLSRNYRSPPKNVLIGAPPSWHVYTRYHPELDEGLLLEGNVVQSPPGCIADRSYSVFGLMRGDGHDTLGAAKEWVDDYIHEQQLKGKR
jgi:hypothetical protein